MVILIASSFSVASWSVHDVLHCIILLNSSYVQLFYLYFYLQIAADQYIVMFDELHTQPFKLFGILLRNTKVNIQKVHYIKIDSFMMSTFVLDIIYCNTNFKHFSFIIYIEIPKCLP